ncbi:MFS multidrug transporter-like protein [Mollisia scopiformis]|uniref:MFS multidrug transporter-like protein n=1 Tax=Mollisia scopiformis TaxID=149040 RepID=A0A194X153_MOLSC|nr:MFS multidrug transporter-like protein [Mollisia scopiformis]KUJ13592.1 MFS multidrug transporter-like protein [Mollisia scopiformis]
MSEKESSTPASNSLRMMEEGAPPQGPPILGPPGAPNEPILPKWRLICLFVSVCFGLFLSLIDTTIVATALFTIGEDLKAIGSINWVALAYTLSYLGCAVLFARMADVTGRRNAYVAAFIIFFAFSLGCGFSQTLHQLIACRVLQGIGGSGLYSLAFVIIPEIAPQPKMQQLTGAVIGAVVAIAGVLGPVVGGAITHGTTWRWIFWINAPIGIIPLIAFIIAWPKPHQIHHPERRSLKQLDFLGAGLIIAASVLVVFSFQEAGLRADVWNNAIFIAPLVVGIILWIALFGWEVVAARKWESTLMTMFPLRLIKRRVFMGHFVTTLLAGFPYFMVIYSLPLRVQVVNGRSQLTAGVSLMPMLGAVAVASTVSGMVNSKKDFIFITLLAGAILMTIGTATLSSLENVVALPAKMYGFQVFVGLGFGLMVSTVSMGASLECELKDRTVAQGIVAQSRVLGGSIGIAASTAILGIHQNSQLIKTHIVTSFQLETLQNSVRDMTPFQLSAVRQTYSDSFSESMKVCAAISGACVLATLLTFRKQKMDIMGRRKEQFIDNMKFVAAQKQKAAAVKAAPASKS